MTAVAEQVRILPDEASYGAARAAAIRYRNVEGVKQKLVLQLSAFDRIAKKQQIPLEAIVPPEFLEWHAEAIDALERQLRALNREILAPWKGTALYAFVTETTGLSDATVRLLSLVPLLDRFPNPAKLHRFCGLHPPGMPPAGKEDQAYDHRLKSYAVIRVAEPTMKNATSPYRAVYVDRKARLFSQGEMLTEAETDCPSCLAAYAKRRQTKKNGWDCRNMGGPHYKKGHAHADALRVMAKAILLDLWLVGNGKSPRYAA